MVITGSTYCCAIELDIELMASSTITIVFATSKLHVELAVRAPIPPLLPVDEEGLVEAQLMAGKLVHSCFISSSMLH